jgi:hypothetical protein
VCAKHVDKLLVLSAQTADSFQNRKVGLAGSILFQTLSAADPDIPVRSEASGKGIDERRLANAGFSGNKYDLTLTSKHFPDPASHSRQGVFATDDPLLGIWQMRRRTEKALLLRGSAAFAERGRSLQSNR